MPLIADMPPHQRTSLIAVAPATALQQKAAASLAQRLKLATACLTDTGYRFLLVVAENRLELRQTGPNAPGPVFADFAGGAVAYRRRHSGGRKQPLARAAGLKKNQTPTVLDATGGLGRDAFVLACLGCHVHLVERSPIVGALLEDGLKRAAEAPETGGIIRGRITLSVGDSMELAGKLCAANRPDVVYLDPMYPHRTKSALVKKEMRLLRAIVGEDLDAPSLLKTMLSCARQRVVVKRPRLAEALEGPAPSLIISSKNSRFDVYLTAVEP